MKHYIRETKRIDEGPGAGYFIKAKNFIFESGGILDITSVETVKTQYSNANAYVIEGTANLKGYVNSMYAKSYYYNTGNIEEAECELTQFKITLYDEDINEDKPVAADNIDKSTLQKILVDTLRYASSDVVYGGGWSHTTYDGTIVNDKDLLDTDYYEVTAVIKLTDSDLINYIDKAVQGENYDIYYQTDDMEIFDTAEEAYVLFASNRRAVKGIA